VGTRSRQPKIAWNWAVEVLQGAVKLVRLVAESRFRGESTTRAACSAGSPIRIQSSLSLGSRVLRFGTQFFALDGPMKLRVSAGIR
jgi:hypothetical protein